MTDPHTAAVPANGVALRTLVVGALPLLVVGLELREDEDEGEDAAPLRRRLREAGVLAVPGFVGVELPRGARVGFTLDRDELRLVDERDTALLRAPRSGVAADWRDRAVGLKGTMLLVADGVALTPDVDDRALVATLDGAGRAGRLLGAIVGVVEERPTLPLLFG